jgi:shikimate dehydrogenase
MRIPYAEVIGDPIAHSKSPLIHNFWLKSLDLRGEYLATNVTAGALPDYIARRKADPSWRGCNVTMPLKAAALAEADEIHPHARLAGAANLLLPRKDRLVAWNTDVIGILEALPVPAMTPNDEVCILGTGGAARAALAACKQRNIGIVLISARDQEAGWQLLHEFGFGGIVTPLEDPHNIRTADVIINATPLGMTGSSALPTSLLEHIRDPTPQAVFLDMVYVPLETEFMRVAAEAGCRVIGGLEMLIGQAAAAFELLFGAPAPREHDAELRELLSR